MKTISPSLQDFLLNNPTFGRADLISITLPNGAEMNVNYGTDVDITYLGTTYYSAYYGTWERGAFLNEASYSPSSNQMELTAIFQPDIPFPRTNIPMMQAVSTGVFKGSIVNIQTLFWPEGGQPSDGVSMGTMKLNVGQIGNATKTGRSKATFEVNDALYVLNRPVPPFQIQSQCRHTLFDAGCTLSASDWKSNAVALTGGNTQTLINLNPPNRINSHTYAQFDVIGVSDVLYMAVVGGAAGTTTPSFNTARSALTTDGAVTWVSMNDAYALGWLVFATGNNAGFKATIKSMTAVGYQLTLVKPMPFPIADSDTVQLVPGCDKSLATCTGAFNNQLHYGGMPFVPNPQVAA